MEELYSETYLKAKPSPKRTALRFGLIFLCLFLVAFDLMVLKSLYLLIFVFIVDAMIIYFLPKKNVAEYVGQMLEYGNFIEHFVSDFYDNLHNCSACTSVTGLCQNSGTS